MRLSKQMRVALWRIAGGERARVRGGTERALVARGLVGEHWRAGVTPAGLAEMDAQLDRIDWAFTEQGR